ncbi:MFS transporter [Sporosarcina sp. 179-K 3D1 HS]|uniref:MFS transporter n=1 Tax=Sporosarcina sp. 179-K 3D1 HS TaxID=3232169 RepID=UPI0039A378C4
MNDQRWLSLSFLAFFFTWGIFLPYWTGWLNMEKGLSVTHASIIMGAGMVARTFSTFLVFPYLTRKLSMIHVIRWTTLLSLLLALVYLPVSPFVVLLVITILFSAVYPMILPAVESGASLLMKSGRIHYGKSRSFGSIGYTVALLLVGAVTSLWGGQAILFMMIMSLLLATVFFMQTAPKALQRKPIAKGRAAQKVNFKSLFTTKGFAVALWLAILLQGAHASYYNFGFIFLDDLGVNGFMIGILLNIAVLFEILFFTRADRLLANVRISTMFLLAGLASTARWLLIYLFPSTVVFIGTQLLHAVTFGVAHYAFVAFISERLPASHIAPAQGMYAAFAMSLSTAILTFPGGYLYDISPELAFLGMTICTIPATILVWAKRKQLDGPY